MTSEQEVRTRAGWIGVEISKSRVRTPGKAGYGLYRVRTAAERHWHVPHEKVGADGEWTPYAFPLEAIDLAVTYAIEHGTHDGPGKLMLMPDGSDPDLPMGYEVPVRWTSAYRGRRDLGVTAMRGLERDLDELARTDPAVREASASYDRMREDVLRKAEGIPVTVKPEFGALVSALASLVDAGLVQMRHDPEACSCSGTQRLTAACVDRTVRDAQVRGLAEKEAFRNRRPAMTFRCPVDLGEIEGQCRGTVRIAPGDLQGMCDRGGHWTSREAAAASELAAEALRELSVRERRRGQSAAFQEVHAVAREHGLRARHAGKLKRLGGQAE